MRFIFTFAEKFRRDQIDRYCWECEKQFEPKKGLTMWCSRRCAKKTGKRAIASNPSGPGRVFHRPWEG